MEITVDKLEVLQDVKREVEYVGMKRGDYDKIRAIDVDDEMLRRWISKACLGIESELRELIESTLSTSSTWCMHIRNVNDKDTWASAAAQSYVESCVLRDWFALVYPEIVETYNIRASESFGELKRLAYYRKKIS